MPKIDEEKLKKLISLINIDSLKKLMDRINEIEHFNKENFQKKTNLSDEQLQNIGLDDEEFYHHKETWTDSISEVIKQQPKEQDSAVAITQYGPVMEICGEDKQETIRSVYEAYKKFTGRLPESNRYESQEEFLAATENQNLPEDVKQEVCKAGFPLTVYTLKFQSKQQHQNFQLEIQDLINNRKLIPLGSNLQGVFKKLCQR